MKHKDETHKDGKLLDQIILLVCAHGLTPRPVRKRKKKQEPNNQATEQMEDLINVVWQLVPSYFPHKQPMGMDLAACDSAPHSVRSIVQHYLPRMHEDDLNQPEWQKTIRRVLAGEIRYQRFLPVQDPLDRTALSESDLGQARERLEMYDWQLV